MIIKPRVLKGFRDFLPEAEIARRNLVEKIESSFRSYGFVPIDTPALEYSEILFGKGGGETEKQVYRFKDSGDRDVALRFDLTVPLARFLAEHREELCFPFKRYHIAKVWRGENTQRGRYREFTQCDFDIIGSDTAAADFEILHIMRNTLLAISGGDVIIRYNHRGLFNSFLTRLGLLDKSVEILRAVDKLAKIGPEAVAQTLSELTGAVKAEEILKFVGAKNGSNGTNSFDETLAAMTGDTGPYPETERLALLRRFMLDAGIADSFVLDPSITRGLDYYTGVVFESFLVDLPDLGSVCSGGRYDNLVGLYSKEPLAGVGASIGIDRLIAGLESLGRIKAEKTYANIGIACVAANAGACQALAEKLRRMGIPCEVFLEEEKLTRQFQAAEKRGLRWLIIPDSPPEGALILRDLRKRENIEKLGIEGIVERVNKKT
ncbi:MAG: histidine--tRNA ligase [Treponema sp.]|jgi:histidyl-tRNA synthetase|nr:histidine--tRNA ligase [Treponema sp.]